MKLYYHPGACSLSPHIVMREAGLDIELERVDLTTGQIVASGESFRTVNPKGYVPALALDSGEVLTEGAALVQYLADSRPDAALAPAAGTLERARVNEWLVFLSSELHKAFSPLFNPDIAEADRKAAIEKVRNRLDFIEQTLADGRPWLAGETFSIADAYLFTLTNWAGPTKVGLDGHTHLPAFMARMQQRPAVRAALEAEGLLEAVG